MSNPRMVLVTGATGRQGGAVARHLLEAGWSVRALTRDPAQPNAIALQEAGADVIRGDLNEPEHLRHFFEDVYGVFSVQNPWVVGLKREVVHGKRIADFAAKAGVKHFVYSSAGPGLPGTGVPHFDSKLQIEAHIKKMGLPATIVRPTGFMELMSDKDFVPPLVAWNVAGKMLGEDFPLSWIATDDIGAVVLRVFENPDAYIHRELMIAGDQKSLEECREIYQSVYKKWPRSLPVPVWLFRWMQNDLYRMYEWMKTVRDPDDIVQNTRAIHPDVMDVVTWMRKQRHISLSAPIEALGQNS